MTDFNETRKSYTGGMPIEVHIGVGATYSEEQARTYQEKIFDPDNCDEYADFGGGRCQLGGRSSSSGFRNGETITLKEPAKTNAGVEVSAAISSPTIAIAGLRPEVIGKLGYSQGQLADWRVEYLGGGGLNWSITDDRGAMGIRANILGAVTVSGRDGEARGGLGLYAGGGLFMGAMNNILALDFHGPLAGDAADFRGSISLQRRF